jgi:hypothetical protein
MKFHKGPAGTYRFTVDGETYLAVRNEAGFAVRQWELWKVEAERSFMLDDHFATRAAVVGSVMATKARRARIAAFVGRLQLAQELVADGTCKTIDEASALVDRIAEDKRARPAQYQPI